MQKKPALKMKPAKAAGKRAGTPSFLGTLARGLTSAELPYLLPAGRAGFALAWLLTALAGGSILGSWRLWGVPSIPLGIIRADPPGLMVLFGIGAAAFAGLAALWWWLGGKGLALSALSRALALQWFALPLLLSWLPLGGDSNEGRIWTIYGMIALAGLGGLLAAYSLPREASGPSFSRRTMLLLLGGAIAAVGLSYSLATILSLRRMVNASYTDFGGCHNALWNSLHGRLMWCDNWDQGPAMVGNIWREHLSIFLLIPGLFLLVCEKAETLLVVQAFSLASAAIPIYLMAWRETRSRAFAFALALALLLSPFLSRITMYQVHELIFALPLLAWLLWACRGKAPAWLFLTFGILSLLVREDMALPVLAIGVWEATLGRRPARGIALGLLALAWSVLSINFFMPSAAHGHWLWQSGASGHLDRYTHLGASYSQIALNLASHPLQFLQLLAGGEKLPSFVLLLLPLLFLPLASPGRLWLALPVFLLHALSNWELQNTLDCHYSAPLLPFLFFAAIGGAGNVIRLAEAKRDGALDLERWNAWSWRVLGAGLVMLALFAQLFTTRWRPGFANVMTPYDGRSHLTIAAFPWRPALWQLRTSQRILLELRRILPARAGLATLDTCVPHFTARPVVRSFRKLGAKPMEDLDYILISTEIESYMKPEEFVKQVNVIIQDPKWRLILNHGGVALFGRAGKVPKEVLEELDALRRKYPEGEQNRPLQLSP